MKVFNRPVGLLDKKTGTCSSDAVTLHAQSGVITTESKTTAAAAVVTITLTNNQIKTNSVVLASLGNGTNTQGVPILNTVTPADGSVVIKFSNEHASQAFNGTFKISFLVVTPYN